MDALASPDCSGGGDSDFSDSYSADVLQEEYVEDMPNE